MLSKSCLRAGWEAERESIRDFLVKEKKFNPRTVDKAVTNYIESVVFAGVPCKTKRGIEAAWRQYKRESE